METYDAVVVGGGPAGATAANELAARGYAVLLVDRGGRIKPCGGAIPPRAMEDFAIPEHLLVARARSARMVAPSGRCVDMPIDHGFVGLVDREHFDEFLRMRAESSGARRLRARFDRVERDEAGAAIVRLTLHHDEACPQVLRVRARAIIGADGALSEVGRQCVPGADHVPCVFAYHEIVRAPRQGFDGSRCDVYYQGRVSPDFYGWVFPHGDTVSVGVGSARRGFSIRGGTTLLRGLSGLASADTLRREGAPIPMRPLRRWDNGRDVLLAGDAAGVVAPAAGAGIYYAMSGGRLAADSVHDFLTTGDARALAQARRRFMKAHGRVFMVLGMMQRFWYGSDARRERFVGICRDPDVQHLTWQAYMHKRLVRARPLAHVRIFFKDLAHLFGIVSP